MYKKLAIAAAIAAMSAGAQAVVVINFENVDDIANPSASGYAKFLLSGLRGAVGDLTSTNNNSNLLVSQSYGGFTWTETTAGSLQLYSEFRALNKLTSAVDTYISPAGTAPTSAFGNWVAAVNNSGSSVSFSQASAFNLSSIDFFASKANEVITVKGYVGSGTTAIASWQSSALSAGTFLSQSFDSSFATATRIEITSLKGSLGFDNVTAVPEPSTYAMLLAGLGMMGVIARRRSRRA